MVDEDQFENFIKWYGDTYKKEEKPRVISIYNKNDHLIAVQDYDAVCRPVYYICVMKWSFYWRVKIEKHNEN